MQITSFSFFVFVAVTLAVYFLCVPKKYQWVVLLLAGFVFYAFVDISLLIYVYITVVTVFYGALWVEKSRRPKLIIAAIVIFNFAILASFKWWNTIAGAGNMLLGMYTQTDMRLPFNSLLLPLGISFYTFQAVGYLIDVYRGTIQPERNIAKFALFVSFFPQLIQGPISRHSELADQLYAPRKFNYTEALRGFQLMLWGLFKKLVIADRLILMVTAIFPAVSESDDYKGLYILIGIIAHVIWLYMDFSGGVDIARGVGQMFGIIMPQNFIRPFFSTTLPEYWRRWHATLNNWWRDYLFYPLLRSNGMTKFSKFVRKNVNSGLGKVIGVYISINVVRVINAMWHGADMFYIVEGFYFGILIVLGMALAPVFKKLINTLRINTECFSWRLFQIIRTFILVCISRVFMATAGVTAGFAALTSIIRDYNPWIMHNENPLAIGLDAIDLRIATISLLVVFAVEIIQERGIAIRSTLAKQNIAFQWLITMTGVFIVLLWGRYGIGYDAVGFLYMGF